MEFLKSLFENGAIDWDTFSKVVSEKGYKIADLSQGGYVSKNKYDDDLNAKTTQINDLTGQINQRNTDLQALQEKMNNVQGDATKVTELTNQITKLREDYTKSENKFKEQIAKQQYEFAVKEFANSQKFSSSAAKRDFIHNMNKKGLNFENGKLVGANDYLEEYRKDNADSFIVDVPEPKPQFTSTAKQQPTQKLNPFLSAMHFTGVRPEYKKD